MEDVILTGPKHSGKTSAGKELACLCSCDFIDIDELIFQRTGKSSRRLFSEAPAFFQKAEVEAMMSLADSSSVTDSDVKKRRVIAAGGGIIDNSEALAILKKINAKKVYLDISAENAWNRIASSADGELPPFLRTDNPKETHHVLHERRAAAYLQIADIVIEVKEKSPKEIAAEIFSNLK